MTRGGTGYGYINPLVSAAAKTGTSQSFIDTDADGVVDTETYSKAILGFVPAENPIVSFTVISPNVSHPNDKYSYTSNVNKRITQEVSQKFFEFYE